MKTGSIGQAYEFKLEKAEVEDLKSILLSIFGNNWRLDTIGIFAFTPGRYDIERLQKLSEAEYITNLMNFVFNNKVEAVDWARTIPWPPKDKLVNAIWMTLMFFFGDQDWAKAGLEIAADFYPQERVWAMQSAVQNTFLLMMLELVSQYPEGFLDWLVAKS